MMNDLKDGQVPLEDMPGALLAELFPRGIVVIPGEYEASSKVLEAVENAPAPLPEPPIESKVEEAPLPLISEKTEPLSWLGNFSRKVLVVVQDHKALHLNEPDFELLGKVLAAVHLSVADIALVNAAKHALEYYSLQETLPAQVALYFGIEPVQIGAPIKFPHFQVQKWNHTTFICAPSLSEMNKDSLEARNLKKELWDALKKVFTA